MVCLRLQTASFYTTILYSESCFLFHAIFSYFRALYHALKFFRNNGNGYYFKH